VTFNIEKENLISFGLIGIIFSLVFGRLFSELILFFFIIYFLSRLYTKEIVLKEILFTKVYLLYFFFFYLIINFFINHYYYESSPSASRVFFYFRFFILFLICKIYLSEKILDKVLKYCSFLLIFLSLDIIFQYFVGYNIIGLPIIDSRPSSFFGKELIADSFISKFYLLGFGYVFYKVDNINNFKKYLILFSILFIFFIAINMANGRAPLLTFFISFILLFLFFRRLRLFLFLTSLIFLLFSFLFLENQPNISNRWLSAFNDKYNNKTFFEINKISKSGFKDKVIDKFYTVLDNSGHLPLMTTALNIWSQNKVIGAGLGSFRHECNLEKYKLSLKYKYDSCSTHPHNYYLETLSELGVVGILFFIIFTFKIIFDFVLMYKNVLVKKYLFNHIMIKIFFINFLSYALVLTSGSFFNNWVSFCFWINISFFYSIYFRNSPKT
jgi:O-antigen ligase